MTRWAVRRQQRNMRRAAWQAVDDQVAALKLLRDPTAFRITRPGWENVNYLPDPNRPGLALAVAAPEDISHARTR